MGLLVVLIEFQSKNSQCETQAGPGLGKRSWCGEGLSSHLSDNALSPFRLYCSGLSVNPGARIAYIDVVGRRCWRSGCRQAANGEMAETNPVHIVEQVGVSMYEKTFQEANPDLTTTSRLKQWYMVQFRGYTVVQCREIPKVTPMGRLTYDCLWQLRAPEGRKEALHVSKTGTKR